jgi:hypothetical protein
LDRLHRFRVTVPVAENNPVALNVTTGAVPGGLFSVPASASAADRPGAVAELAPAPGGWLPDDTLALAWPPPELPEPPEPPQPAVQARPATPAAHSSQVVGILLTVPPERPPGPSATPGCECDA